MERQDELKLSDRLAVDRTVMAAERTIMAWVRTAVSLISFGFTLYKVISQLATEAVRLAHPAGPKRLGLFLIFVGTTALAGGMWEYWRTSIRLGRTPREILCSPSAVLAGAVFLLGLVLFVTIAFRFEVV
jgi:putative membrane protein